MNISKTKLEGLFVEELDFLQPTPAYMRVIKESVLRVWQQRRAAIKEDVASSERRVKAIQQKLDRLDEAFIFAREHDRPRLVRAATRSASRRADARADRSARLGA